MDIFRLRYLLLVFVLLIGYPSFGQKNEERLHANHPPFVIFLSDYIKIPSVTGSENEAGLFLAEACRSFGLHVHVFTDDPGSLNFSASLYPLDLGKPNIIFLTHIDVVPEGDHSLWTYPPYGGVIADGHLWGRGAFDNKGHGVMQLFALSSFVEEASIRDFPYNFTLLAVSNEETDGSLGAGLIAENYLFELSPVAVFGEGGIGCTEIVSSQPDRPMFGIEVAQKRAFWLRLQSSGAEFGHGSVPSAVYPSREVTMAAHAILSAKNKPVHTPLVMTMLKEIGNHEKGVRKVALKNYRLLSPLINRKVCQEELINALMHNTITLTHLGGSEGAYNQMATNAWATFDVRLLPGTSTEKYLANLRKKIRNYDVEIFVIKESPPSPVSHMGKYYNALCEAILENFNDVSITPMLMPATNDNLYFRAKGIPAYGLVPAVFKPEHVQSIHNVNERIPLTALSEGIDVYKSLIRILSTRLIASD